MDGSKLYKFAIPHVKTLINEVLTEAGLTISDIRVVTPHQASGPALHSLRFFGIAEEKVDNIAGEYENCVAASNPMALATAHHEGRLQRGDRVRLVGTGAGMSEGTAVL